MPDALISFVFSFLLAAAGVFYVTFLCDRVSRARTTAAFSLSAMLAVASMPLYSAMVCVTYLPLWAGGYIGGLSTLLPVWVVAQVTLHLMGMPGVCWSSSLLMGVLGWLWACLPISRTDHKRLMLTAATAGVFLMWPIRHDARLLLMAGVLGLALFTWHLEHISMRRAVWQQYFAERGYVLVFGSCGDVLLTSPALQRDLGVAEVLKRCAYTHYQQVGSVVPIEHAERHWLMTLAWIPLPMGEVGRMASFQDVTRATQAAQEMAQFFALSAEGFGVCSTQGHLLVANQALAAMLGCSVDGSSDVCVMNFVHPEERDKVLLLAEDLRSESAQHVRVDLRLLHSGSEYRWAHVAGVYSKEDEVIYVVVHDIHERHLRELNLNEKYRQESEQAKMLAMVREAIIVFSLDGVIRYWNKGAEQLYGYRVSDALSCTECNLLSTRYPAWPAFIKEQVCEAGIWQGVVARTAAGGETKLCEVRWAILRDAAGTPRDIVELSSDVTADLRDGSRREQLAAIVESTEDAVISLSFDGTTLTYNRGAEQMCGYTRDEVCGRHFLELVAPENHAAVAEMLCRAGEGASVDDYSNLLPHKTGVPLCTRASIVPMRDALGKIYGLSILARDVTEERTMERESARLERLSVMGQLAAGIGHELRNPLTTVRGFLQLFAKNPELASVHSQLAVMLADLESAHAITSQFLALARNSACEMKCANLNHLVQGVLPLVRADAHMRDCQVIVRTQGLPCQRLAERDISQLILNLARNGLQSMGAGGVLTISTEESAGRVLLNVSDTGHGITQEVADKMWAPFFTTRDGAVGLGLAVCECIAKHHGAKITFNTNAQGTTFTVSFLGEETVC